MMRTQAGIIVVRWELVERTFCTLLGIIHTALGVAIVAGGPGRFPPPNYTPLLLFTNYAVWPYAILWSMGGLCMVSVFRPMRFAGLVLAILMCNLWASLFAVAAYQSPNASITPSVAYGGYGLLNATMFALMIMMTRHPNEDT